MKFLKQIYQQLIKNHLKILFGGAAAPPDPPNYAFIIYIKIRNLIVRAEFTLFCKETHTIIFFPYSARKMSMKSQEVKLIHETNVSF